MGIPCLFSGGNVHGSETLVGAINVALSITHVSVSVANNFIHSSTAADQGYHAFGELARFIYCLLQKIKKAFTLPPVEQWEEYVVPNHSRFAAIDDQNFLVGTRVMASLDKVGSHYLQKEFRRDARRFLEDFVNFVLSIAAARSVIGQGLSCFCPAIVVGGDDVAPLQYFNNLLDGLLEKGWTKGSEVEARRAEYQSFVQEQRQLERSSTRIRPDVGDVLSFCSGQAGFLARRHLYKVCIVASQTCGSNPFVLSHPSMWLCISGVPVDDACDPWVFSKRRGVHHQFGSCRHQKGGSAWCPALCAGLCSESALYAEEFLLGNRLEHVVGIYCYR